MGLGVWVLGDHCKGLGFRVLATSAIEFYDACSKIGRAVLRSRIQTHKTSQSSSTPYKHLMLDGQQIQEWLGIIYWTINIPVTLTLGPGAQRRTNA